MEPLEIILNSPEKTSKKPFGFNWLTQAMVRGKAVAARNLALLLAGTAVISLLVAYTGALGGGLFVLAIAAVPLIQAIVLKPKFGIITLMIVGHFIMYIIKFVPNVPLGTLIDGLEVLLIIGFFIHQKKENNWQILRGRISVLMVIWIGYNFAEVANPAAASVLAWVYTVRSVAIIMLMYFIFIYHIRSVAFIKTILKFWLILSSVGALYGLKQQLFGFSAIEEQFVNSDPTVAQLLFIGGEWRKFSIFSDPVTFSYNMVVSSLLCIALMTGPLVTWKKVVLGLMTAFFMYVMVFSGTRGAYVLVPITMILFAILKFSKKILAIVVVAAAFLTFLILLPTSNNSLYRFQTAFRPTKDASFNVRKENQKRIQPYILSHPMGGGLGATGVWGVRFAPTSFLASFPPDSGYVRVAVEMGWIGLFLFCFLMFSVLKTGITNYYAIKNPELKSYCLAMLLIAFALNIGNYPQEALVQFPSNIYFYLVIALITITYRIDRQIQDRLAGEAAK